MRGMVRIIPWALAAAGLGIPLVASAGQAWPFVLVWTVVLGVGWFFGGVMLPLRSHRIIAAVILLPVLVMLAFEGGWWLIPADVAWLVIEVVDTKPRRNPEAAAI